MSDDFTFSDAARSVWAKSRMDPAQSGRADGWLPLSQHLADTAGIAKHLWDEWAPASVRRTIAEAVGSPDAARALVVWLAGVHDVGKASPAFGLKVPALADRMQQAGLAYDPQILLGDRKTWPRHDVVSHLAIRDHLRDVHGIAYTQATTIASVAAAHHGNPATVGTITDAADMPHLIGVDRWASVRSEFLSAADGAYLTEGAVGVWAGARLTKPALVLISALVIVADWLASGDAFDLSDLHATPSESTAVRVERAWRAYDFPRPWRAHPPVSDPGELLRMRFGLTDVEARPAQAALVSEALALTRPELLILEAETGSGKTEAALLAAEILAARFGMAGIFVGLPTQATTDGMFARILPWARHLDLEQPASLFLAHGNAALNEEYSSLSFGSVGESNGHADGAPSEAIFAHRWFSAPRRGPLSTFVVGTVDQALFAGHRSRYAMLRHLALASKVVVIDEVHAYDDYMMQFLERVLEWLGAYGVPTILLSATLPAETRASLAMAYESGRTSEPEGEPTARLPRREAMRMREERATAARARRDVFAHTDVYPAITATKAGEEPRVTAPGPSMAARSVALREIGDDDEALLELLRDALREGGNIAVIRTSVRRAQNTARMLRSALPGMDVVLAHSRYLAVDRARKDRALLEQYGRNGRRPTTSVVVATQVIEQSLDIDFDLMITDLAPIDLLLQRMGRLHRHPRTDRPRPLRSPTLVLAGVDRTIAPPRLEQDAARIYGASTLLRTLAVLEAQPQITTPHDVTRLVNTVYGADPDVVPEPWRNVAAEAAATDSRLRASKRHKAGAFTLDHVAEGTTDLLGWVSGPDVDPELTPPGRGRGTVRGSDENTLDVIALERVEGQLRTPSWLPRGGSLAVPLNEAPSWWLSKTLRGCRLTLPGGMCWGSALDRHIDTLERRFEFPAWHGSHLLKGELALVFENGRARLNEYALTYDVEDGLRFERVDDVDRAR